MIFRGGYSVLTKRLAPLFGLMAFAGMTLSQEAKKDEAKKYVLEYGQK